MTVRERNIYYFLAIFIDQGPRPLPPPPAPSRPLADRAVGAEAKDRPMSRTLSAECSAVVDQGRTMGAITLPLSTQW